jgi:hypothetical protein
MPKTKISEFDVDPANNTDINSINIAEGCAPSGINNAIRQLMSDLKEFQTGAGGDPFNGAVNGTVGATTPAAGAFTTLSATGVATVSAGSVSAPAITTTGDTNTGIFFPAADTIAFTEGGTESMRIDSSGNLGIGITPSAWASGTPAVQYKYYGSLWNYSDGSFQMSQNIYFDGSNWKYLSTAAASNMYLAGGACIWQNAASGTSGATATLSERMRIDSSGKVLIGTTTSIVKLTVVDTDPVVATFKSDSASGAGYYIDNSGRASGKKFGVLVGNVANGALSIKDETAGADRLVIDSSGNLLVGTTSGSNHRFLKTSAGGLVAQFYNESTNTSSSVLDLNVNYTGNTTGHYIRAGDNAAYRFYVYTNGNVTNQNNSYGSTSDIKLKENIVDATPKLEKLNQVRVVNYNLIGGEQKQIGVIAQELEQIFPSMIDETADRDEEGNDLGTTTKSVKYSVFVPMLIKAIQEQQAIINDLKARIETLESK